ncbi:DUF4397 domain-containing protein [Abyssisolibacter fermentans]|uniref:DUF4397 domain-containing protein n=1 Tax=Abyssisolibacter fermentans TaxID=1766203 RepID=UPI0008329FEB|nr:DUF4397 domain-containing protein [Abyssisolibacter fermentans]
MYYDYYNYYNYYNNYYNAMPINRNSYLRFMHASPDAPGVDIYLNNSLVASNLRYQGFTPYMPLLPGSYNVKVYAAGMQTDPVINTTIDVLQDADYTVAVAGTLNNLKPVIISDTAMAMPGNEAQIKFVHLSPDAPAVDVTLPNGVELFENIEYKEISPNSLVPPANYTIQVRDNATKQVVLTVPNVLLKANKYYTVYAVGLLNGNPELQAIIALDKASY